jgi:hypothetical protein
MAMLAPVHVENFGRFFGRNEPICAHSTGENRAAPLLLHAFSAFQEALSYNPNYQRHEKFDHYLCLNKQAFEEPNLIILGSTS